MLGTVLLDARNSMGHMTDVVLGLRISALKGEVLGQENSLEWNIYTDGFSPIDINVWGLINLLWKDFSQLNLFSQVMDSGHQA